MIAYELELMSNPLTHAVSGAIALARDTGLSIGQRPAPAEQARGGRELKTDLDSGGGKSQDQCP